MWSKPLDGSDGVPSDHTEDDWSRESAEDTDLEAENSLIRDVASPMSELDRKVGEKINKNKSNVQVFVMYTQIKFLG